MFEQKALREALGALIRQTSSVLPPDVQAALERAKRREVRGSAARSALLAIEENIAIAAQLASPICQDTGTNLYFVDAPETLAEAPLKQALLWATRRATKLGYLRPNVVDPVTGKNTGDNVGRSNPQVHIHRRKRKSLRVTLMLKGGGCENVSTQYALPNAELGAGRDLEGVRRCIIDAAYQAQGKGCAPGILGVGIGGDRLSSHVVAKEQLLRPVGSATADPALAKLERRALREVNKLGIGPMGFGGKTTALGVMLGVADRLPASYFVTIAYMCWACRRATLVLQPGGSYRVEQS